jgi:hypothetical protein
MQFKDHVKNAKSLGYICKYSYNPNDENCLGYPSITRNNITVKYCASCKHYDYLRNKIESSELSLKHKNKHSPNSSKTEEFSEQSLLFSNVD